MKYILSLLLFLSFFATTHAQVPGYMGRRAWVSFDMNFIPALTNMNQNHKVVKRDMLGIEARSRGTSLLAFNYRPQLTFEYLVAKHTALGLSYGLIRTGTIKEVKSDNPDMRGVHYDLLRGGSVGFHIKKFNFKKSASIAPIGYYWDLGLAAAKFNTYTPGKPDQGQFHQDVINPVITIGFGKQKVFFDKFIFNSGAEFGWSFMPKDANKMDYVQEGDHENGLSIHHAYRSLMGYYLFNLKASFGYLAF